jgi:hypothetical protein
MKALFLSLLCFLCAPTCTYAGELKYSVADIPEPLLKNANSVIRVHETTFAVIDLDRARETVHYVVTLLNAKASNEAEIRVYYDDNSSVSYLDFRIYNALGLDITRSFKKLEVTDESAIPDGTMYSDHRCKVISPVFAQYPVTIEYSYGVSLSTSINYPAWIPLKSTSTSLQHATFTLVTPKGMKSRFKEVNKVLPPIINSDDKSDNITWEINDIASVEIEPFSPPIYECLPFLLLAPGQLRYNGVNASFQNWDDLGKYIAYLNKGRDVLPAETITKLHDLVKDCTNDHDKVKAVYKYMQGHTRYVGVQIGIGGLQPIPADFIDKKGYGDCKGLVNYTKAMLKAVGIESFYTLVNSGEYANPVIKAFPCNQFDHIILCVPIKGDTTWLECTSQRQAFGFLGSFTHNRDALLITENGGKIVHTPKYEIDKNISIRNANIVLDSEGNATTKIVTIVKGLQSEDVEEVINDSPEEQKKGYYKRSGLPDSKINALKYSLTGDYLPIGCEEADIFVPAFASKTNNRFFVPLVLPDRSYSPPVVSTPRTNPVVIRQSFIDTDTLRFSLPAGVEIEYKPEKQVIDSKFGHYSLSVEQEGRQLLSIRSFSFYENRYEASEYTDFISFLKKIAKADLSKLVLKQKI